jgi:hypothetical protein
MVELDLLDRQQLEYGSMHLHTRGPRALAEFLAESAADLGGMTAILRRLEEYHQGPSAQVVRLFGADQFPPRRIRLVPDDFGEAS